MLGERCGNKTQGEAKMSHSVQMISDNMQKDCCLQWNSMSWKRMACFYLQHGNLFFLRLLSRRLHYIKTKTLLFGLKSNLQQDCVCKIEFSEHVL